MPEIAVEADDLEIRLNKFCLKVDSFSIKKSEKVCFFGPNGSGKTTFAKLLTGYLQPERGKIKIFGKDVSSLNPKERARLISYAGFDSSPVQLEKTVEDFVELGAFSRDRASSIKEEVKEILELTGLYHKRKQIVSTLSAGELQRAFIAQLLIQKPSIVILDEPTAHLDLYWQVGVMETVDAFLKQSNPTVIYILHDLNLALNRFTRMVCFNEGRIAADLSISTVNEKKKALEKISEIYGIEIKPIIEDDKVVGVYF